MRNYNSIINVCKIKYTIFIRSEKKNAGTMRSVAFPICLFLNVMLFGMCGYMYLLWLQYWHRIWNQKQQESEYDVSDFHRNEVVMEYYDDSSIFATSHHKTQTKNEKEKKPILSFLHKDKYSGKMAAIRYNIYIKLLTVLIPI